MLTFVVVASRTGRPLNRAGLGRFETAAVAEVPFRPDESVTWANDAGTVWFAGWRPSGGDDLEAGWHIDAEGLIAVAGRVWPRREGWAGTAPVARQLADRLRSEPLAKSAETLAGVFAVAALAHRGSSAVTTDPLGIGLLYWGRSEEVVVLSTRASVAAEVLATATGSTARRDAFGAGWLAYAGHAMGAWTGYEDISVVPAGSVIEIDSQGRVELCQQPQPIWRAGGEALVSDPVGALDQVRDEIIVAVRTALRDSRTDGAAGLTGGKDSRLILAMLLASDMARDLEFQTLGSDDLPDVVIARQLAATYGLHHRTNPGVRRGMEWWRRLRDTLGLQTSADRETAFRITTARTSASHNVAEPHLGRLPPSHALLLSGLCGEALRTNYPNTTRYRSKRQAARFPDQFGRVGILTADALDRYRHEIHALLFDETTETDSPQDVIDAFYLRQRLRRWGGSTVEIDSHARMFPLYSITGIQLAFAIGGENRHAAWIHHHLIRGADGHLVDVPFANGEWAPEAAGELAATKEYDDPVPVRPPPAAGRSTQRKRTELRTVSRERRARQHATDLTIMRRLFEPDAANPAFDLLDRRGVQRALDGFDLLPSNQRVQLYGALTTVIWLGGHELALPRDLATA